MEKKSNKTHKDTFKLLSSYNEDDGFTEAIHKYTERCL